MSGLLERIVRRRRATAISRLGPPQQNGRPSPYGFSYLNGAAATHVNGSAPVEEEAVAEMLAPPTPEPALVEPEPALVEPEPALVEPEPRDVLEPRDVREPDPRPEVVPLAQVEADYPAGLAAAAPSVVDDDAPTTEYRAVRAEDLDTELWDLPESEGVEEVAAPPELQALALALPEPVYVAPEPPADPADSRPPADPADSPSPARAADAPPAEPALPEPDHPEPAFLARGRMRRRARFLRRLREIQFRDLGGFMLELHRFGEQRPDLIMAKVAMAAHTDAELRALEQALDGEVPPRSLREPGIGGACPNCGAIHGSEDRFCSNCGESLRDHGAGADPYFER